MEKTRGANPTDSDGHGLTESNREEIARLAREYGASFIPNANTLCHGDSEPTLHCNCHSYILSEVRRVKLDTRTSFRTAWRVLMALAGLVTIVSVVGLADAIFGR